MRRRFRASDAGSAAAAREGDRLLLVLLPRVIESGRLSKANPDSRTSRLDSCGDVARVSIPGVDSTGSAPVPCLRPRRRRHSSSRWASISRGRGTISWAVFDRLGWRSRRGMSCSAGRAPRARERTPSRPETSASSRGCSRRGVDSSVPGLGSVPTPCHGSLETVDAPLPRLGAAVVAASVSEENFIRPWGFPAALSGEGACFEHRPTRRAGEVETGALRAFRASQPASRMHDSGTVHRLLSPPARLEPASPYASLPGCVQLIEALERKKLHFRDKFQQDMTFSR